MSASRFMWALEGKASFSWLTKKTSGTPFAAKIQRDGNVKDIKILLTGKKIPQSSWQGFESELLISLRGQTSPQKTLPRVNPPCLEAWGCHFGFWTFLLKYFLLQKCYEYFRKLSGQKCTKFCEWLSHPFLLFFSVLLFYFSNFSIFSTFSTFPQLQKW